MLEKPTRSLTPQHMLLLLDLLFYYRKQMVICPTVAEGCELIEMKVLSL